MCASTSSASPSPGRAGRVGRHEVVALHARLRDARIGKRDGARRLLRRLLRPHARLDVGDARNLAVGLLGELLDLVGGDVAGDDQDGVVGRVEAAIEFERIFARELLDLVPPADDRPAIGMVEIERCIHLLGQARAGIVRDPHVLLFQHHLQLGLHHVVGQHQAGHAVGLELHQELELVAGGALEIAGEVVGGEGVLRAADGRDRLREQALRVLLRALEQQMFEEVGEPRLAGRLVGGADAIPDHVGDDRRAAIGNHHDFEAVGESEMGDFGAGCSRCQDSVRQAG